MHDACRVSLSQAFGNLREIFQEFGHLSLFAVNLVAQCYSIDKLHRDEVCAITLTNLINVRNVRMIERRRSLGFLRESAHAILISSEVGGKNLQRDSAIRVSCHAPDTPRPFLQRRVV